MNALDELIATLDRTHPKLVDRWEATAVVESLGYTDRRVAESFGVASTLALGSLLLREQRRHPGAAAVATPPPVQNTSGEATLAKAAMSSLIYAMPWLLVFLTESWNPEILHLAPGLAAPLTLALMASLVVSGGFVQAIARRAQFCVGIAQPGVARATCLYLILAGLVAAAVVAGAGVMVGWYFSLFSMRFLVLAALYFIVASALWMHCAVLGVGRQSWRIPLVFVAGAAAFLVVRMLGVSTLVAQVAAITAALMCAAAQFQQIFAVQDSAPIDKARVNPWIVAHGLVPYFLYGVLYFSFLVADRIAAGAAVASRGGAFNVPPVYKDGMDIALLTFLLAGAVLECCNLILMRGWRQTAQLPYGAGFARGASSLLWRWHALTAVMVAAFAGVAFAIRQVAEPLTRRSIDGLAGTILIVGDIGYLLFAVGLLNALALLSIDRGSSATRSLTAAVVINLVTGTVLGHLFGAYYASAGLAAGGVVFAVDTSRKLHRTLENADTLYPSA